VRPSYALAREARHLIDGLLNAFGLHASGRLVANPLYMTAEVNRTVGPAAAPIIMY
jgi:hypothetical protein